MISARAKGVATGEFITAMGGWNPAQFKEKRLPTLAELDKAAPDHPVLVYLAFTGPRATNSKGKDFFTSKGVAVSETGQIAANAPSLAALNALRAAQTFEDKKRGTLDAMNYAARVGVTTSADMGAFVIPGTPDMQDSFISTRSPAAIRSACMTRFWRCIAKGRCRCGCGFSGSRWTRTTRSRC